VLNSKQRARVQKHSPPFLEQRGVFIRPHVKHLPPENHFATRHQKNALSNKGMRLMHKQSGNAPCLRARHACCLEWIELRLYQCVITVFMQHPNSARVHSRQNVRCVIQCEHGAELHSPAAAAAALGRLGITNSDASSRFFLPFFFRPLLLV
jgi:hypothetical protein